MTALDKYVLTSLKPRRSSHRQCSGSLTVSPIASGQPPCTHKPIIDEGDDRRHAGDCGWADCRSRSEVSACGVVCLGRRCQNEMSPIQAESLQRGFRLEDGRIDERICE